MEKARNWKQKSKKNRPRQVEKSTPKAGKSRPGAVLGGLGGDLGKKNDLEAVLTDFGRFWTGAGSPKWQQDGRTWRQDGARWSQDGPRQGLAGHLEASWGAILGIFGSLGADLCKNG